MNIFERVKNILFSPKEEWEVIKEESYEISELYKKYVLILAAIPAVAGYLGNLIFGVSVNVSSVSLPLGANIKWVFVIYIAAIIGVTLIAYIIDIMAPYFGASKDLLESFKIAVYASTASWVGGIIHIVPALSGLVFLASIYSFVLLYLGLERLKNVPKDKMIGYFVVVVLWAIVVSAVTGTIVTTITV
ncbi:Yip1 family protein [Bacteroidota bacterium]